MSVQTTYASDQSAAFRGMLYDAAPHTVVTMYNEEASAEMAFGLAVCFGSADGAALAPDATSDKIAGILLHSHAYAQSDLGDTGVLPDGTLNVLRKGRVWVKVEEAVAVGDRLFIRAVAAGAEEEGAIRKSADASDCIDSSNQGVFLTAASANGLALLEVDFTNNPT